MPRPALIQAWLFAALLAALWAQRPRFQCNTEGSDVICTSDDSRVEFLDKTATWREAHELCRQRRGFLVPSRGVFANTLLGELYERAEAHGEFWLGAKYLRNGYYGWLLQTYDDGASQHELLGSFPAVDPSNLCGRSTTTNNELGLGWERCDHTQKVVCFSGEETDAETGPAGYQPSLSVIYGDTVIEPRKSADEVLFVNRTSLEGDFYLNITCGAGDSIVKDHFILGKTRYLSSWWSSNFTIMQQMLPLDGSNHLGVGTYWCQRYVENEVNPVVSGRLHVATSENMYVLTAPEGSVVETLQLLFSDVADRIVPHTSDLWALYYRVVAAPLNPNSSSDQQRSGQPQLDIVSALEVFLRSVSNQPRFLALYDFPNSRTMRHEASSAAEEISSERTRKVSLVMELTNIFDSEMLEMLRGTKRTGDDAQSELFLREALRCPDKNVGGRTWRQASNGVGYIASEPVCVAPGLTALVERRCRPSFDHAGAQWGPFCAAGVCQEQLPQCEPPPPICPPGFRSTAESSELPSELCILVLPRVTFEERGSECRRHDPRSTPWFPQQRQSLRLPFLVNQTLWLPFRRLWSRGTLLPQVLDLLNCADRKNASLNGDLDCTVVTPRGWLVSSSCTARHAVVCTTRPLYAHDVQRTLHRSSARGRLCQFLLGFGAMPTEGSERCFTFLCPDKSSRISWFEASSLCKESNSSLASLTSQRQLDAVIRLGRARGSLAHAAVNLEKQNGRVVWGDGTPLSYPALSPDLSRAEQDTRGILDISRGQYDFVRGDNGFVSCALCDRYIEFGPPEIVLFYGDPRPGARMGKNNSIFANVTNIRHFVADWEDALSCFVSTAKIASTDKSTALNAPLIRVSPKPRDCPAGALEGFRVTTMNVLSTSDNTVFIQLETPVAFGFLTCGLLIPELGEQVTSNSLALMKQSEAPSVQEYVIGLRGSQWLGSLCDITFCGAVCPCFNQSLRRRDLLERKKQHLIFARNMHPIRTTSSNDSKVIEHYYVTLEFESVPHRNESTDLKGPRNNADQLNNSSQRFPRQDPASPDGFQILRDDFGSQLDYLKHARCCPPETTQEPVELSWPETCNGASTSVELCMDGSGRPALRRCVGSPLTGVYWEPVDFDGTSCATESAVTTNLRQLSQVKVTEATTISTAAELERLTADPTALVTQDLVYTAETLENIQAGLEGRNSSLSPDLSMLQRNTVATVSHIMDADRLAIADATKLKEVGPRVIQAMERVLIGSITDSAPNVTTTNGSVTGSAPNVTTDNVAVRSGDIVGIVSSSREIDGSSLRTIIRDDSQSALFGVETALLLEGKKPNIPVVLVIYRDGRLLQSRGQRVTSQVVSVLMPTKLEEAKLHSEVMMTFRSRPGQCVPAPVCAFWNTTTSQWSTRGCWLEKVYNGSDVCRCNHLTNFARIFNYEPDKYLSEAYHRTLDVITYIGSTLSLFGLFLTMFTFVLFKKWRRFCSNQIVMHMSVALTGVYLTFLGSLAATENHVACVCLSALLHFFLLATFGWMAVEAVFQYMRCVRVFAYIPRFMLKASLLVWGGSLVPVSCVLATRPHCYDGQPGVCWMDFQTYYYAVVAPIVATIAFNAGTFGRIVYSLYCNRQEGLRTNQPERQQAQLRLRVSFVIFVLLGLPWVFGFLSIRETRLVFSVLFCVCSMLQGFAIFLLMVTRERGARNAWRSLLAGRCCATEAETAASFRMMHSTTGEPSQSLTPSGGQQDSRL